MSAAKSARTGLAPEPQSAGAGRRFVRATLAQWARDDLIDISCLLVSELVTNAVLHARTEVALVVSLAHDVLRVEVRDAGAGEPAVRHYHLDATTGRGLALVASLATRWGVDDAEPGKSVWFELAV